MSKKRLEAWLEMIPPHPGPDPELEQYTLPSSLAAELVWRAYMDGALQEKVVADLGCGTGRLAIASALLGASLAVGVDIDARALHVAKEAAERLGVAAQLDLIRAKIPHLSLRADTVVQNPPFGVRRRGADRPFVELGISCADVVYSLHKSTRGARRLFAELAKQHKMKMLLLGSYKLRLPPLLPFHAKRFHEFRVDLFVFRSPRARPAPSS
jgi:putative methylase